MAKTKKTRRPSGEGSIYFDEAKQLWRGMITTPAGKRQTKSSKTEDVVKDWLNEQRLLIGRKQHIEPHTMTLQQWIGEWLETYKRGKVKHRTYDRYQSLLLHMAPLSERRLQDLTTVDIQGVLNTLQAANLSARTVSHVHDCLRNCLNKAVDLKLIASNPVKGSEKPRAHKKDIQIYTKDEVKKLMAAAEKYRNPLIIQVLYYTGMRISEVLAIRRCDINTKKRAISVNKTVHYSESAGVYYSDTKTGSSRRLVDSLPVKLIADLIKHAASAGATGEDVIFRDSKGAGESPHNYAYRVFSEIRKAAGVQKGLHTFRHTHATELLSAGVPIHDVSRRLGHANVSTTHNIYAQFMPDSDRRMSAAIDSLMSKIQ